MWCSTAIIPLRSPGSGPKLSRGTWSPRTTTPNRRGFANRRHPNFPRLYFQKVPEPKLVKNRVHLDLRANDVDAEVARLVEIGAVEIHRHGTWVTLRHPEGNEFCVDKL
jgi:hypothetical protein